MKCNSDYTYSTLREWLIELCGAHHVTEDFPSASAICQSVLRISAKICKLKKERNSPSKFERIQAFLQDEYCLPEICDRIADAAAEFITEDKPMYMTCDNILQDINVELCRNLTQSKLDKKSRK